MLDPDVLNGRIGERAADAIVLVTVHALVVLAQNHKVRQFYILAGGRSLDTGDAAGQIVAVYAHRIAARRRREVQGGIPHTRALDGHVIDTLNLSAEGISSLRSEE